MATSSSSDGNSSSAPGTPQDEMRQPIATAAGELVKCRADGEPDWGTLGKVLTASVLGEALCISYADFKYGRMTRGSDLDINWKFAYEEKGVIVLRKITTPSQHQNPICFAGRGVLNFPVEHVASILADFENSIQWNKFLVEVRELKVLSQTEKVKEGLGYFVHENKQCFARARRDFCVYANLTHMDDGKCVLSGISVDHPCCPPVKGTVRGKIYLGSGWLLEPYEGNPAKTLATYIANVDLCAPIPASFTNRLLQSQPLTIYHLKKYLKSLNQISHGLTSRHQLVTRIDSDLETSLTSTVQGPDSFLVVGSQRSTLYREQMGVDHFMGRNKGKRPDILIEEDECSSTQTSLCARSNSAS